MSIGATVAVWIFLLVCLFFLPLFALARWTTKKKNKNFEQIESDLANNIPVFAYQMEDGTSLILDKNGVKIQYNSAVLDLPYKDIAKAGFFASKHAFGLDIKLRDEAANKINTFLDFVPQSSLAYKPFSNPFSSLFSFQKNTIGMPMISRSKKSVFIAFPPRQLNIYRNEGFAAAINKRVAGK